MTDNKTQVELLVGIEAALGSLLQRVLQQGVQDAAAIERNLAKSVDNLQQMQKAAKMMGVVTRAASSGSPLTQVINAQAAGARREVAADRELLRQFEKAMRMAGEGASEAKIKKAFRDVLISEGRQAPPATNENAIAKFNRETFPMYLRAQQAWEQKRTQEILKAQEKADQIRRRAETENWEKDSRARRRAEEVYQRAQAENWEKDSRARRRAEEVYQRAQAENWQRESKTRLREEEMARRQVRRMVSQAGIQDAIQSGDVNRINQLRNMARSRLTGRYRQVDDEFIDGLFKEHTDSAAFSRAHRNLQDAERDLRNLFTAANKVADQAERLRIRNEGISGTAARRGVDRSVLERRWDQMEADRDFRRSIVPERVRLERPERQQSTRLGRLAGRMQLFGDYAAIGATVGAVGYTAYQVAELEKALATLKAISGATDGQMAALSKTIKDVGQNSSYSLREISAAATTLAQAGYTVSEVSKVLPDITNLALASGSELQTSVDIFSSVLTVFDMNLAESAYVADALTQALNGSKLSMDQFALGIQYAGNAAAQGGVSFEELTAALGAMSNAGIRSGSTLGTGLTALLQDLQAPSEKFRAELDKQGISLSEIDLKTHGLVDVLDTLQRAQIDSSKGFELFDTRAARAYSALVNNQEILKFMSENFTENGAAAAAAAGQMDTLIAQLTRLGNAAVEFTSVFGAPVILALKAVFGGLADLLTALAGAPPLVRAATVAVVAFGVAVAVLNKQIMATALGPRMPLALGLQALTANLKQAIIQIGLFGRALLTSPLGWFAMGIGAVVGVLAYLTGETDRARNAAEKFKEEAAEQRGEAEELATTIDNLSKFTATLSTSQEDVNSLVAEAERRFAKYGLELSDTITTTNELADATRGLARDLEGLRLERLKAEQSLLENEARQLQKVGASNVGTAEGRIRNGRGGTSLLWGRILGSSEWKALKDGEITTEELTDAINMLTRMKNGASANETQLIDKMITDLVANNFRVDLTTNTQNRMMAADATNRSTIANSSGFRGRSLGGGEGQVGWEEFIQDLATNVSRDLVDGRLPLDRENNLNSNVLPMLEREIQRRAVDISRETGLPVDDVIRQMKENPHYVALRGYNGNPAHMDRTALQRAKSSTEQQWRTTAPANRAALQKKAEEYHVAEYQRFVNPGATEREVNEELSRYRADTFSGPLTAQQSGRTYNTALETQRDTAYAALERAAAGTPVMTASGQILRPISASAGSPFGMRRGRMHNGTDYPAGVGTEVIAPLGGVATSGYDENNGNFVRIRHDNGMESMLIHLSKALETIGTEGIRVEAGQLVGYSGNTGASQGPHLHWQLKDASGNPVDPETMVGKNAGGGVSSVMQRSLAEMEARWAEYRAAEYAVFEAESSEAPEAERAYGRAKLETRLAQEREKFFQEDAGAVYKAVLEYLGDQITEDTQRALRAVSVGDDTAAEQVAGVKQLLRETMVIAIEDAERTIIGEQERRNAINTITKEYADKISDLTIQVLEAEANRVAQAFEESARARELGYARSQGRIDARGNANWARNGSAAYGIIRGRDQEKLDEQRAREAAAVAEQRLFQAQVDLGAARMAYNEAVANGASETKISELSAGVQAAELSVKTLADEFSRANIELSTLTDKAYEFASPIDAMRGAFAAFVEQANLNRPIFNTLADGLLETFNVARGGFKQLVVDVASGTKTMGDAFRDFTLSVLGSLLDLAAEILAQEILKMIIGMFLPGMNQGSLGSLMGGASKGGASAFNVSRRAQGGPAPNRDSALTLLEPGEFVMSKTATDFIGRDTLSRMNASGNRRMSSMPTVAQAVRREPDEVNVWVVAPDQPRPMGKKDVVAAISQDLLENGQTRRLIRAIQVGAI